MDKPILHRKGMLLFITIALICAIGIYAVMNTILKSDKIESISFDLKTASLEIGETIELSYSFRLGNSSNETVKWFSSDETVAQVYDGIVRGITAGTASITATIANGKTATCIVSVKKAPVPTETVVKSISDVEFIDGEDGIMFIFALQDKNGVRVKSPASVKLVIINSDGKTVYSKTIDVNNSDFFVSNGNDGETSLLAGIILNDSDFIKTSTSSGSVYYTISYANLFSFPEDMITTDQLPISY